MANHKSAIKRARQSEVRRLRNMTHKTKLKNVIKRVRSDVENNASEEARESLVRAVSMLQKTVSKGVIHRKNASRRISRLTRRVNQLASSQGAAPAEGQ